MKKTKILIYETSDIIRIKMANALSALSHVGMTMITNEFDMVINGSGDCVPDIIIMDIAQALPRKKELAAFRVAHPGVKLMLHSVMVDEEFNGCAKELGADVFFDFMELVAEVSENMKAKAV